MQTTWTLLSKRTRRHIEQFRVNTGFQLSYEKTNLYRLGSMKKANARLYTATEMSWSDKISVLGIDIVENQEVECNINYESVMKKTESVFNSWANRNLSLYGKIAIINSLVSSLYVYKMSSIPNIPQHIHRKLDKQIESFIWNGRRPKIKSDILKGKKRDGGAGLVDMNVKQISLKCKWVRTILQEEYPPNIVYKSLKAPMNDKMWLCNISSADVKSMDIYNKFWKDVWCSWCEYHFDEEINCDQYLWWNSHIRIGDKPICWKKPLMMGLKFVSQLMVNGEYKPPHDVKHSYGINVMEFNMIKSAIPNKVKEKANVQHTDERMLNYIQQEKTSKFVYNKLCHRKNIGLDVICDRWEKEIGADPGELDVKGAIQQIPQLSSNEKLKSFQYRMLLRAIVTNIQLKKWKVKETDLCSMCEKETETVRHLFAECEYAIQMWVVVKDVCKEMNAPIHDMSYWSLIVCNIGSRVANSICLIAKQYIYWKRCICKLPNHIELRTRIYNAKSMEKYYAIQKHSLPTYLKRWETSSHQEDQGISDYVQQYNHMREEFLE